MNILDKINDYLIESNKTDKKVGEVLDKSNIAYGELDVKDQKKVDEILKLVRKGSISVDKAITMLKKYN